MKELEMIPRNRETHQQQKRKNIHQKKDTM
jgi:hypothetical protein